MTRVLVTGATGFIGRHALAPLASLGFDVHAVTSRAEPPPELACAATWHRGDLLDPDGAAAVVAACAPERLLHLAWYAEHGAFWTSAENLRWVEASLRLLRAFADAGGRRAVLAGTCAEYDWSRPRLAERETPLAPATLYGASKHGLHVVARAFAKEAGLSLAWGRVFFLYGPYEDPRRLVSSVALALLRGEEARTSAGTQVRDFLHVEDVAAAFAALVGSEIAGPVNVAAGEPVTIRSVVEAVAEAAGRPELLRVGALPARDGDPPSLAASADRLRREVGWEPAWSLEDGLRATVEWWRGQE